MIDNDSARRAQLEDRIETDSCDVLQPGTIGGCSCDQLSNARIDFPSVTDQSQQSICVTVRWMSLR
jgi:hypothetical protein